MIVDCISDLHGHYPKLIGGDLLIIAGDITSNDSIKSWDHWFKWLDKQEYRKKIYIGGNHDNFLTHCANNVECIYIEYTTECAKQEYLCDSGTEFEGVKIWGTPWTKTFPRMNPKCKAFTVDTEEELYDKFVQIPEDTNILITHGPPFGILDGIPIEDGSHFHVGSESLRKRIFDDQDGLFSNLKLLVFGHIHENGGKRFTTDFLCMNCSYVNERYKPVNKVMRVIL